MRFECAFFLHIPLPRMRFQYASYALVFYLGRISSDLAPFARDIYTKYRVTTILITSFSTRGQPRKSWITVRVKGAERSPNRRDFWQKCICSIYTRGNHLEVKHSLINFLPKKMITLLFPHPPTLLPSLDY